MATKYINIPHLPTVNSKCSMTSTSYPEENTVMFGAVESVLNVKLEPMYCIMLISAIPKHLKFKSLNFTKQEYEFHV